MHCLACSCWLVLLPLSHSGPVSAPPEATWNSRLVGFPDHNDSVVSPAESYPMLRVLAFEGTLKLQDSLLRCSLGRFGDS